LADLSKVKLNNSIYNFKDEAARSRVIVSDTEPTDPNNVIWINPDTAIPVLVPTMDDLALKANINSPAFTGVPTAPTPFLGDSTNRIATTAFVKASMLGSIHIVIRDGFAGL
jgi:hypothetical protein